MFICRSLARLRSTRPWEDYSATHRCTLAHTHTNAHTLKKKINPQICKFVKCLSCSAFGRQRAVCVCVGGWAGRGSYKGTCMQKLHHPWPSRVCLCVHTSSVLSQQHCSVEALPACFDLSGSHLDLHACHHTHTRTHTRRQIVSWVTTKRLFLFFLSFFYFIFMLL